MNKDISREQKEKTYIDLMVEWGQPAHFIDYCKEHLVEQTDDELKREIEVIKRAIKDEEAHASIKKFFMYLFSIFWILVVIGVIIGIVGLLVFGIKQLF